MIAETFSNNPYDLFKLNTDSEILDLSILIPLYHLIWDERLPHISHLYSYPSTKTFESHLKFLLKRYTPISLEDLLRYCTQGYALPKRVMHLTFDDGLNSNCETIAPVLLRYGVPATFFLTTEFIDNRALFFRHKVSLLINDLATSWPTPNCIQGISEILDCKLNSFDDAKRTLLSVSYTHSNILDKIAVLINVDFDAYLKTVKPYVTFRDVQYLIKQGFSIGAHSVDHPRFCELTKEEQLSQAMSSVKYISDKFAVSQPSFAFPFTDQGVEASIIQQMHDYGIIPTFGTRGLQPRKPSLHLQRLGLDGVPFIE